MCRWPNVFANGQGDRGSIPSRAIPMTQKMLLDAALLSIKHYKIRFKGKVDQYSVVALGKGAFASPSTKVANFTLLI